MRGLKGRIILTVFASAFTVFALSFLIAGTVLQISTQNRLDTMTELIAKNGGEFPAREQYEALGASSSLFMFKFTDEVPYRVRYFAVYPEDGMDPRVLTEHIAAVDGIRAIEMAKEVLKGGSETGYYERYRYRVTHDPEGVIFLDATYELENIENGLLITAFVELLFLLLIMGVFSAVSGRVVKPFEDNAAAQRQFITDASHELKTPVAIISANAEVLAYKDGESEWVSSILEQTRRMDDLVGEMMTLSRLEEAETLGSNKMEPVDVSRLVADEVDGFGEVFATRGIEVERNIAENIKVNANENQVKRLCSILLENASKYADEGGRVSVSLKKGPRFVMLTVFNECEVSDDVDYDHLFDRFYRPDSSRASSTGGHGIGLSIAKRIVELHGGSISAKPSDEGMTFSATLSARLKATREDAPKEG